MSDSLHTEHCRRNPWFPNGCVCGQVFNEMSDEDWQKLEDANKRKADRQAQEARDYQEQLRRERGEA